MNKARRRSVSATSMPLRPTALIALIAAAAALAGCGQKGDLYLPPPDKAASAPAR
ncbi:LPS translocon maturation chaperone LptM [Azohydromonas sediminis]|uniref:LPS translocon maturation chaperone LptM n=1 Tax=Azohydromonas sediminis TaxID=2259674 RepID=UPI001B354506|nr:lipoprotein [Azohydromonas sediminis]